MKCSCFTCRGREIQTHIWCRKCNAHVTASHKKLNPDHRVFSMGRKSSKVRPAFHVRDLIKDPLPVPDTYDLRVVGTGGFQGAGPIYDQETTGACVSFAWANVKMMQAAKDFATWIALSQEFIYDEGRTQHNAFGQAGMESIWGPQLLQSMGTCELTLDPYQNTDTGTMPTAAAIANAKKYMTGIIVECTSVDDMKQAILKYGPIGIGIPCFNEIMSVGADGIIPMPTPGEKSIGGHELCVVGWLIINGVKYFIIKNSWYEIPYVMPWGDKGFGYLPEAYMTQFFAATDPDLHADSYANADLPVGPTPPTTKYSCVNGQCIEDPNGTFGSLADCQAACSPSPQPDCEQQFIDCIQNWDGQDYSVLLNCIINYYMCSGSAGKARAALVLFSRPFMYKLKERDYRALFAIVTLGLTGLFGFLAGNYTAAFTYFAGLASGFALLYSTQKKGA